MARAIGQSEILLLIVTIIFQLVAFLTVLRVATGVAATNPTNTPGGTIVIPKSLNETVVIPPSTPQFQNPVGNGLNGSLILVALFIVANVIVISILALLYRRKKMKLFSMFVSVFLIFNVTLLFFSFISGLTTNIPFEVAGIVSLITIASALAGSSKLVNFLGFFVALELGCSFPVLLQAPLNYVIPAVYAVFDLYAIYYGRMGKLVKQVADGSVTATSAQPPQGRLSLSKWPDFGLLTVNFPHIEIGMADIAFYTMLPAIALTLVGSLAFIVVMLVADIGLISSFFIFRNKEISPGLPIPILLGLVALFVMYFLR